MPQPKSSPKPAAPTRKRRTLAFTVGLPPLGLSLNRAGAHWAVRAKLTAEAKKDAWGSCLEALGALGVYGVWSWQAMTVIYLWRSKGVQPDPSAVIERAKATLDGVVLTGLIPGDDARYVKGFTVLYEKGPPALVVTLEEVG